MKPASQAHVSAATAREPAPQSAPTIGRAERAERLKDYFALQLRFAEAVAATGAMPLEDAVAQCTNFYRRFGFGRWQDAPITPAWYQYIAQLITTWKVIREIWGAQKVLFFEINRLWKRP